ncbi:MAG: zf-HC2 domain-containing protein [Elusimicrobiales bacterium]|nr:zf-HC2 domain-containing protein [Elusimicrobiales bacterium]
MLFKSCTEVGQKLSAYMDGELSPEDRAGLKAHLDKCPACSAELLSYSAVDSGMRLLPPVAPNPFFAAKVAAAARSHSGEIVSFRRFLRLPVPAMALMVSFILINLFTFAFNINAMENGPRRELARKVVAQLVRPASIINPVAIARLCGECNKYMCLCMHEAGKKSLCPCKDCEMEKMQQPGKPEAMKNMEEHHVH